MAKSLRSKSKQRVKRLRRVKFYEREKKKCWEKHQSLEDQKNDQEMDVEANSKLRKLRVDRFRSQHYLY